MPARVFTDSSNYRLFQAFEFTLPRFEHTDTTVDSEIAPSALVAAQFAGDGGDVGSARGADLIVKLAAARVAYLDKLSHCLPFLR